MKLRQLLKNVDIQRSEIDLDTEVTQVSIDTRKGIMNGLYAALPSLSDPSRHGMDYAAKAAEGGAVAILTDRDGDSAGLPKILVKDARFAYAFAASAQENHPGNELTMIGVTGTKGKTSTTHFIYSTLLHCGIKAGLIGTNEILYGDTRLQANSTTPEAGELYHVLRMMADDGVTHVVMEVSSHALDVGRVAPLRFAAGAFLNLSQDHLDYFGDMQSLLLAKAKLGEITGQLSVNADDPASRLVMEKATGKVWRFSTEDESADLVAKNVQLKPNGAIFDALTTGTMRRIRMSTPGRFTVYNGLAACSVLLSLGLDMDRIADGLSAAPGVSGRAQVVDIGEDFTVMVDYSHSPESLKEILEAVRPFTQGRIITVFGCGGNRDNKKRPIMGAIAAEKSNFVIITSDNPRFEEPDEIIRQIKAGITEKHIPVLTEADRPTAIKMAIREAKEGDLVLIAGKGHEDYQEVRGVKHHMDDRELAVEAAEELRREKK